jgi:hypothetical protein
MFEQTSRLAEKLAASVSRRGFLGSLGGWAAAAAMGVAGVLAFGGKHKPSPAGAFAVSTGLELSLIRSTWPIAKTAPRP